ncbi:Ldh family oxidoreductase [Aquibaculum arenosum]|uniref:Ldh family oxidoreductase n=1 Tax=Aquibaculum arenosum TaxID=3032591 RepID=UPI002AC33D9B|nr:Ldh family oxidoreductase [Fodinicurvata sp. CAU 1616]
MTDGAPPPAAYRVVPENLAAFSRQVLAAAGADEPTAEAATRAMMHGSLHGVDSHGIRLLDHYATVLESGRVNPAPEVTLKRTARATTLLDADDGHGALAGYRAMEEAATLAQDCGLAAVGIVNSSHFGPAGAYALAAAEADMIGLVTCNADSFVRLHEGAERFHGTNPIACAVPVAGQKPWLLDMASSAVPFNRVQLYKSLGQDLPPDVASDERGEDTANPEAVAMLAPLGGAFGFKGAGLAGLAEILSAVVTGMRLSFELLPMGGPDLSTPRKLGAFALAMCPDAFVSRDDFQAGMEHYLEALRASPARASGQVMAPGDREWAEAEQRRRNGIPIDPTTLENFERLAERYRLSVP